jgi:hypothetical protein
MADVEQRVSVIEQDLKEIAYAQRKTEMSLQRLSAEMREFKDEMREFKDEMRADRKQMNREWGNLANKMGTIVEDIILPGFAGILRRYFDTDPELIMPRPRRRDPNERSRMREFDIIAVDDVHLFINETKSRPSVASAQAFIENHRDVLTFFPAYADLTIVPMYSALSLPSEVVEVLSKNGCYAVAPGDEHLEVLNFEDVQRR